VDRILEDVQSFFVDDEGYDFGTSCKASFTWKRKFIHLYLEFTADLFESIDLYIAYVSTEVFSIIVVYCRPQAAWIC
jgi:hypothetical protein